MRTVYVIGAGASCEVGLPIGSELKARISEVLHMKFSYGSFEGGNYDLYDALNRRFRGDGEIGQYLKECRHICKNMPLAISIDNFIDSESENKRLALCGKIGIVDAILAAERSSKLYFDSNRAAGGLSFVDLEGTWYLNFFRTLTENCKVECLKERFSSVTLIIFNYDRCVEHFLINALRSYYRLDQSSAAEILEHLKIIHPYGVVGGLVWQSQNRNDSVDFGSEIVPDALIDFAGHIHTFTEGGRLDAMDDVRGVMECVERLVFLGFAFHRLNMDFLSGNSSQKYRNQNSVKCYATAYGASKNDRDSIASSIYSLYEGDVLAHIEDKKCARLFVDNSRSLGYL